MTLSRMDEEESPLKLSDFAVSEAVEETTESFRDFARSQGHPLELAIGRIRPAPPTAASVWGSPSPGALPRDTTASSGPNALSRGRSCSRRSCGNGGEVPRK